MPPECFPYLSCFFQDDGDTSHHQSCFKAPDLYAEGGPRDPEDQRDHWTSEPLEASHKLEYVSFRWMDQGWGNRKGTLFLSLDAPGPVAPGDSARESKEHRRLMPDPAEHEWTRVVLKIDPQDPLRRLARAGDRYRLSFIVGGGGGHILQAVGFTLHFGVAGGFIFLLCRHVFLYLVSNDSTPAARGIGVPPSTSAVIYLDRPDGRHLLFCFADRN